jgi:hypothetical protein
MLVPLTESTMPFILTMLPVANVELPEVSSPAPNTSTFVAMSLPLTGAAAERIRTSEPTRICAPWEQLCRRYKKR